MKKFLSIILTLAMVLSLAACGGTQSTQASTSGEKDEVNPESTSQSIVLKAAQDSSETVPVGQGLEKFKELIEERSNGEITVEVYHNGQLGSASDYIVNCQLGTLDIGCVASSILSSFVEDLAAVDIPYLVESYEHADAIFNGDVGDYYRQELEEITGLKAIAIWEIGFRNLTNSKHAVNSVADVTGLRIRTMDNQVHQAFWKQLGADPVPMSWSEAYTAMQQKAIDGQENPLSVILGNNVAEVNNYLAITEHVYSASFFIMSQSTWASLSAEQQQLVVKCAQEAGLTNREVSRAQAQEAIAELEQKGMEVTYPDKQEFIDASAEFRAQYREQYPEIMSMVDAAK